MSKFIKIEVSRKQNTEIIAEVPDSWTDDELHEIFDRTHDVQWLIGSNEVWEQSDFAVEDVNFIDKKEVCHDSYTPRME